MNCLLFSLDGTHGPVILGRLPLKFRMLWDFPGGPVVKNLPFEASGAGSIPGPGLRSHMPRHQNART